MQKKIKDKKAPNKGASQLKRDTSKIKKSESIFNYDIETEAESTEQQKRKKLTKKVKEKKDKNVEEEMYIGAKETPKINRKKLDQIKKKKKREIEKKKRQLLKEEAKEEKEKERRRKKLNTRQIEKIRKIKKAIRVLVLITILVVAIILLILSPIFNIKEIKVINNSKISSQEIISLLNIDENTNIFKETNSMIRNNLKSNSYIDKIVIKRKLPSTLEIQIKERQSDYMLELASSLAYIDSQGYILEISSSKIEGKVKILGYMTSIENIKPGNRLCSEDLDKLNTVSQIIKSANNSNIANIITSINIKDDSDYLIFSEQEKKTIHLGDKSNLDTKMIYVKAILEKEKDKEGEIFVNRDLNKKDPYFSEKI